MSYFSTAISSQSFPSNAKPSGISERDPEPVGLRQRRWSLPPCPRPSRPMPPGLRQHYIGLLMASGLSATLPAQAGPRALPVGVRFAEGASGVAAASLYQTCRHRYQGGRNRRLVVRCVYGGSASVLPVVRPARRSHPALRPARSPYRPPRSSSIALHQSQASPLRSPPAATRWTKSCEAGFAPAWEHRHSTAPASSL